MIWVGRIFVSSHKYHTWTMVMLHRAFDDHKINLRSILLLGQEMSKKQSWLQNWLQLTTYIIFWHRNNYYIRCYLEVGSYGNAALLMPILWWCCTAQLLLLLNMSTCFWTCPCLGSHGRRSIMWSCIIHCFLSFAISQTALIWTRGTWPHQECP